MAKTQREDRRLLYLPSTTDSEAIEAALWRNNVEEVAEFPAQLHGLVESLRSARHLPSEAAAAVRDAFGDAFVSQDVMQRCLVFGRRFGCCV